MGLSIFFILTFHSIYVGTAPVFVLNNLFGCIFFSCLDRFFRPLVQEPDSPSVGLSVRHASSITMRSTHQVLVAQEFHFLFILYIVFPLISAHKIEK